MKGAGRNRTLLWFVILLGAVGGSLVGDALGNSFGAFQFLKNSYAIGTKAPFVLNLKILILTFGINFNVNVMTIVGIIVAIILYRKH